MGKIICFGGIKGGTGKSTLAVNLAVGLQRLGKKILIVDADPQNSIRDWDIYRNDNVANNDLSVIEKTGKNAGQSIQQISKNYDAVIVDLFGRDGMTSRSIYTIADYVIMPFAPRPTELWTVEQSIDIASQAKVMNEKLEIFGIVNRADPVGSDNQKLKDAMIAEGMENIFDFEIVSRKIFAEMFFVGKSVLEQTKDKKAVSEINKFIEAVAKWI